MDQKLSKIGILYRLLRDYWLFINAKPYNTVFGFMLIGDSNLDTSRIHSYEYDLFMEQINKADVFIDIGANVGLFSLIACKHHIPVISIEPCNNNLKHLYKNLIINKFVDVEIFPIALSDEVNILPLFGGGQGASLIKGWGGILSNYQKIVPVNTLSNLIGERYKGKRLLIKIDVEGNEFNILKGASAVLQRVPRPTWIIEHGFKENFQGKINPNFENLFILFWQHDYKAFTCDGEQRLVTKEDVKFWLTKGERCFGGINYLFK